MIIYATKQTFDRFSKLKLPKDLKSPLKEVVSLVIENIGDMIAHYLMGLYKDDKEMLSTLEELFTEKHITCFNKLTDKSVIATLNRAQSDYLEDGYRLYELYKRWCFTYFRNKLCRQF